MTELDRSIIVKQAQATSASLRAMAAVLDAHFMCKRYQGGGLSDALIQLNACAERMTNELPTFEAFTAHVTKEKVPA